MNHFIHSVVIPGGIKFTDEVCIGTVCARNVGIAEVEKFEDADTGIIGLGFSESAMSRQLIVRKLYFGKLIFSQSLANRSIEVAEEGSSPSYFILACTF